MRSSAPAPHACCPAECGTTLTLAAFTISELLTPAPQRTAACCMHDACKRPLVALRSLPRDSRRPSAPFGLASAPFQRAPGQNRLLLRLHPWALPVPWVLQHSRLAAQLCDLLLQFTPLPLAACGPHALPPHLVTIVTRSALPRPTWRHPTQPYSPAHYPANQRPTHSKSYPYFRRPPY